MTPTLPISLLDWTPAVVAVEASAAAVPWSEMNLRSCFAAEYQNFGIWSHDARELYAFILVHQPVADEWTIMNIAVAPQAQRRGYAEALVRYVLAQAARQSAKVFLEVRSSNNAARKLYQKVGFQEVGLRKNYYPTLSDTKEDAIVMLWNKPTEI
ncbi:ribosomal protein S18-alanine N-acetyltransferase [Pseudidiomarina sp.]|uniref:ribosomal protein S18-alanine N-acetyltransferase n=1 Tax=Pseudidiomarina sp. TaxID=2081707 RepID=UPI003A9728C1